MERTKMKRLILFLGLATSACLCPAETRWCSAVAGNSSSHYFFYPAMARMEKIQGVVIGRVTILPSGKVESVEIVSGPPLLSRALHDQLLKWTLRANTDNDDSCQTLVIADFKMSSPYGKDILDEPKPSPPGILRLTVEADPAPDRADTHDTTPPGNLQSRSRTP